MGKISRTVWVGLVVLALGALSAGAAERWQLLGRAEVRDRLDHDAITVTAARGDFRAIKLAVGRAPVHFISVKIHFGNGESQDVDLRAVIPAGGETRAIDVAGPERIIRRVEFWYEAQTLGRHRGSAIRLFGRG